MKQAKNQRTPLSFHFFASITQSISTKVPFQFLLFFFIFNRILFKKPQKLNQKQKPFRNQKHKTTNRFSLSLKNRQKQSIIPDVVISKRSIETPNAQRENNEIQSDPFRPLLNLNLDKCLFLTETKRKKNFRYIIISINTSVV